MKVNFYKLLCKFLSTGKTNNMNLFGKELQERSKKIKPSNYFTGIKEWGYDDFCNRVDNGDPSFIEEIVDCVFNGKVIVVRKQGRLWNDQGTALSNAKSDISRFLLSTTVDLP